MSILSTVGKNYIGVSSMLTENQRSAAITKAAEEAEREKNQGGFWGGLGYVFEKVGLGFLSGVEGIWDYTAGGLAKLFGADDWAEQQFANDWVNYNHADEWFNPSEGWQTAGDVASGIGTSLPAVLGVAAAGAIAYFSGGSLSGVSAGIISGVIAGFGAAGNATKEAYRETGELGGKEFGYGALVGITEGTIEGVSGAIGAGTGAVTKNIAKSFGKEVGETAVRQTLGKTIIKGFVGEAFEEGVATLIDPVWKRITYDPDAKNATFEEVAYASLVGGLAGAIMGGVDVSVRNVGSTIRGNKLLGEGRANDVIATAENISQTAIEQETTTAPVESSADTTATPTETTAETTSETDTTAGTETNDATPEYESFKLVKSILSELKTSMQKTNGQIVNARQKMLLGYLEQANTAAAFEPFIATSAENIYNNAEAVAERMNAYGYTDPNGKPITYTAEQLRAGIDTSSPRAFRRSMSKALRTNSALRGLAIVDATGRLTLDTSRFADATLRGQRLSSQVDLNRFIETADENELRAVGEKLGIESWETLTNEEFQGKITKFVQDGGVETYKNERILAREVESVDPTTAKKTLPRMVNLRADGTYRYTQGNTDIAIVKRGDSYRIYDYSSKRMSKSLTRTEVNKTLKEIHANEANYTESARQFVERQSEIVRRTAEIDAYARENIPDYTKLNAPNQSIIRSIIRQGRAAGVSEDFVLSCARISARSGLNIVFSKEMSFVAANGTYADGAIDLKRNRIIVNPEAKNRTGEMILIHELTHAIYKLDGGVLQVAEGLETMTADEKEKIRKRYAAIGQGSAIEVSDEINAHFAEQTLANKNILERLATKKPSLKQKILAFFKGAKSDYQGDAKLTGAAARLYKQYKKLFDEFAAKNQQRNAVETGTSATSYALSDSLRTLSAYSDAEITSIERNADFSVARSYEDIRGFIDNVEKFDRDKSLFLGKIGDKNAAKILTETGVDVKGKSIVLNSSNLRHIFNNHGNAASEALSGQIAVTKNNIESVIETLVEPDSVERSDENGKVGIMFKKNINGRVMAITILSEKKKALTLKSAWIIKNKQHISPTDNASALPSTSKTGKSMNTVYSNSISETTEKVNPKTAKTTKKFALPDSAAENYQKLIGELNNENHLGTQERAFSSTEIRRLEKIFTAESITQAEDRILYEKAIKKVNGFMEEVLQDGEESLTVKVIKPEYHTSEMIKTTTANKNVGYETKFFIEKMQFSDGENYDIEGLADTDFNVAYVRATSPNTKHIAIERWLKGVIAQFNSNESTVAAISRHERLHLLLNEYLQSDKAKEVLRVARALKYFINAEDGKYVKSFDLVNYWYQTHFTQEGYSFNDYSEEIACDLYSGALKMSDPEIQAAVDEYIDKIDAIIDGSDVGGVRYALDINGETTPVDVEEGRNLVALHNLSEEKLMKVLQLGGFPMPSIAITRVDLGHEQFGGITVVFGRETIDPRSDSRNKVFSRDGYTPTVPRVDYKINDSVLSKISKKYKEIKDKFGEEAARPLYKYVNDMEGVLDFNEGEFSTLSKLYDNVDVMQVFLLDTRGKKIEPVYKEITETLPQERINYLERFIKYFGEEAIAEVTPPKGAALFNHRHQYVDKYRDKLIRFYAEEFELSEADIAESMRDTDLVQTVLDARKYLKNGASQTKSVYDSAETERKIRKAAPEKEYRAWVDSLFEGIQEKTGIRNDKDMFTSVGNRRSFEATHDEYTLENLVKAMKKAPTKGDSGFTGVSVNSLAAKLSKEFKSVNEIRKNAGSLKAFNQDIQDNFIDTARAMINEIEGMLVPQAANGVRGWTELDGASTIIGEIADRGCTTEKQIADFMAREYKNTSYKYSAEVGNKILALFDYVRAMSDTDYFEAKPRRAVSLNEIKMILVPENTSSKLLESLSQKNIPHKVYGTTAEQRAAAVKKLDGVRFALPESDSEGRELSSTQREYFKNSKVVDENGHLIPVYHGTPSTFTVFDINKLGQNTMMFSEGAGFYFTDKQEIAEKYAAANGNIMQVYLNITKPMTIEQAKFTDSIRKKIFRALYEHDSEALSNYSDVEYEGLNAALESAVEIESSCETDIDFIASLINGGVTDRQTILDTVTKLTGYDGVMNRGIATATNRDYMVYVAFNSKQAKNIDNTTPTTSPDIRYALPDVGVDVAHETAVWSATRIDDLIERYGASNPKYTQAYATWINPADFVKLTTINKTSQNRIYEEAGELDLERMRRESQTPFLDLDYEKMKVVGHEGRHRAAALAAAGVKKMAVVIRFTESTKDRYDSQIIDGEHLVKGQQFGYWDTSGKDWKWRTKTSRHSATFGRFIPINEAYRADLSEFTVFNDDFSVQFALDDTDSDVRGNYTVGQRARFAANNTGMRVYSRAEAADVINSIIEERLVLEEYGMYGELKGKDREAAIDYLFTKLNTTKEGYRAGVALKIADFMIEHTVLTDMYAEESVGDAMQILSILRSYMHRIDLAQIRADVQHRFDKKNTIELVWGQKGGIAPDTLGQLLAEEGIHLDAINGADMFFQMYDMYVEARDTVNAAAKKVMLSSFGSQADIESLRQAIARDVLIAYDSRGKKSKFAKLVEKYTAEIARLKQRVRDLQAENRLLNSIVDKAQKMKDLKLGTFLNSTQFKSDVFKQSIEKLARIKNRGNFNIAGTRKIIAELRTWYTKENPLLADNYEQGIADMLDTIAAGTKNYTTDELKMINNVMAYFTNFVEKFNKVYRQGKWVEAIPEATRYIDVIHENETVKVGLFRKLSGSTYMQTFGDPMTVARRMDMYENGFYTEMLQELREAAIDAEVSEMEVKADYEEFMRKHKKYLSQISKEKVKYQGVEIPKTHLIGLYMTLKRSQSHAGLVFNGFSFIDTDGKKVRVQGLAPEITTDLELIQVVARETAALESMMSATDKEYIAILEKGYNTDAKKLKADRDMQRLGFTNATEGYYYPIRRGNIAKNVDTSDVQGELDRVSNSSFNKDTVRGAKQELFIESADIVYNRHIHAVCQYAALSPAIETYNRLYNLDISGNPNKPISVATESANTWAKGNKYFAKLISDIQGIPSSSSEGMRALSFIRGSYAKFQLGANPKVWITQLSSLFSASSILDADSITKGMFISAKGIDDYCSLAKLRNSDNTAAMAQGVIDKVGKFSNFFMAPIGKMDRFVVRRLFGACQVQVEKNGGAKVGTEANKVEAGKLLRKVILETQQNSMATERSAAMRSGNEIMRTLTMFTSDSMKVIGRVIDSIGELSTLRAKLKMTTDPDVQARLKNQIKAAHTKVRKSVTALVLTALFMAGIAQLFRWLYNKDQDEDETVAETIIVDFVGNLFGGLPLIKDVYARLVEGYDVDNYAYSAVNDLLDSASGLFEAVKKIVSDEATSQDIASSVKSLTYSVGQMFGIPTRNLYNVFYGLTKRISPTTAYQIDNVFYKKNYTNDLNKAIENEDDEMAAMLLSLVLNERVGDEMSDSVRETLSRLYKDGYSVLPRTINGSITYNNETIELNDAELSRFKSVYTQANKYVETMVNSKGFKSLSAEQQAKAIKQLYDAYYYKAISDLLKTDANTTIGKLSKWISVDKLSVAFAALSGIESDKDDDGKTISGSRKKKIVEGLMKQNLSDGERLLILCYKGYSIQNGDYKGYTAKRAKHILLKYILSLKNTSQAEKAAIAEQCGFEVKNGRIVRESLYTTNK